MLFVVLCPGTPEGSTGSGSGFKASQKTGQRLKVSFDRLGKAGNRTFDPWFTRHRFIPFTTAAKVILEYRVAVITAGKIKELIYFGNYLKYLIIKLFVAFPWVVTSTGPGGFMICVFIK